jgi:hypothetical protein
MCPNSTNTCKLCARGEEWVALLHMHCITFDEIATKQRGTVIASAK